ncbi:MAG: protein kinase [Acidobacteriota bacterium]
MLGTVLEKRFKVTAALGEGTLGRSFLGVDMRTEGRVAIKFLGRGLQSEPDAKRRFQAAIAMQLSLAGTPRSPEVLAARVDEGFPSGAPPYLIRTYVGGFSLREALQLGEPPALDVSLEVLSTLMSYLGDLESRGFRHGGITPENVILTDTGGIKVVDPGLALPVIQPGASLPDTLARHVVYYAPGYLEPPYFEDIRGDIYSVARIARDLLEIRKDAALTDEAPEAQRLIDDVLGKALQPNPDRRFTSVADFRLAFSGIPGWPALPRREGGEGVGGSGSCSRRYRSDPAMRPSRRELTTTRSSTFRRRARSRTSSGLIARARGPVPPGPRTVRALRHGARGAPRPLEEAQRGLRDAQGPAAVARPTTRSWSTRKSTSRKPSPNSRASWYSRWVPSRRTTPSLPGSPGADAAQPGQDTPDSRAVDEELELDDAADEPRKRRLAKIFRIPGSPGGCRGSALRGGPAASGRTDSAQR